MEITEMLPCPFCGRLNEIPIDTGISRQRFVTDCDTCCRPFEILVECENGEILNLETNAN